MLQLSTEKKFLNNKNLIFGNCPHNQRADVHATSQVHYKILGYVCCIIFAWIDVTAVKVAEMNTVGCKAWKKV